MALLKVINGPNLNLLGTREPKVYGTSTLKQIEDTVRTKAAARGHKIETFQSNDEGALVTSVQDCLSAKVQGLIINPGAYAHTSIALRDAVACLTIPVIEVHLSNIFAREEFRRHSYLSGVVTGLVLGFKADSYYLALEQLMTLVEATN